MVEISETEDEEFTDAMSSPSSANDEDIGFSGAAIWSDED